MQKTISDAIVSFDPPETLDDWELGWYTTAANLLEDDDYVKRAKKENDKRRDPEKPPTDDDILRPSIRGDLVKKESL
jgi:hypothetical protein